MSVIKAKRTLSDLEFYHNAITLRKELTLLLLRDFGIKKKIRDATSITKDMSEVDAQIYNGLVEKYSQVHILEEFPKWFIDKMRSDILTLCHNMIMNIVQANTIYPVYESEFYERRNFQNRAIANCEQLIQEMQYIMSIIPVDADKFIRYTEMIEREIALLKGWRKSDNRIIRRIKNPKAKDKKDFGDSKNSEDSEDSENLEKSDGVKNAEGKD